MYGQQQTLIVVNHVQELQQASIGIEGKSMATPNGAMRLEEAG